MHGLSQISLEERLSALKERMRGRKGTVKKADLVPSHCKDEETGGLCCCVPSAGKQCGVVKSGPRAKRAWSSYWTLSLSFLVCELGMLIPTWF